MSALKNTVQVLSTDYIFVYFSEHLFWARVHPGDSFGGWIGAWIAYSIMAFIFLVLISHFRVQNIWALFLAGAAFGWIGEGILVQTAYEMLPLSISFTGLAWHALITVWVGWYAVRRSLRSPDPWSTLRLSAALGFLYGLWAISWWIETPPEGGVSSITEFAVFSFLTAGFAILAYWLPDWSSAEVLIPNRWAVIFTCVIIAIYFCLVTIPAVPVALIILPILLGLVWRGLSEHRRGNGEGSLLNTLGGHSSFWKYSSLFALPLAALAVYALAMQFTLQWHTNWILYIITTPLGFILFGISCFILWRNKPVFS